MGVICHMFEDFLHTTHFYSVLTEIEIQNKILIIWILWTQVRLYTSHPYSSMVGVAISGFLLFPNCCALFFILIAGLL